VSTSLGGTKMIKPDYIPFSQEIFDECEELRARLKANIEFKHTLEFNEAAIRLVDVILSDEYGRYIRETDGPPAPIDRTKIPEPWLSILNSKETE
jgi:hypothetical protein